MMRRVKTALFALTIVLLLAGCGGKSTKQGRTSTTQSVPSQTATTTATTTASGGVTTHGKYHYPPVVVRNYMQSCVGNGGAKKRAYCGCTLDKLSNNVSTEDFARIGLAHGRIPPRIKRFLAKAIAACANNL
jgi:hypothetical protein